MRERTEFGNFLMKLRLKNDLTVKDLAKEIGASYDSTLCYESGKYNVSEEFISLISDYFNLNESEIKEAKRAAELSRAKICLDLTKYKSEEIALINETLERLEEIKSRGGKILHIAVWEED